MDIILLERNRNLGNLGDTVSVKPGYARNYLLPQGKAVLATPENQARVEANRAELEKRMTETKAKAQAKADTLQGISLTLTGKTADEGKLYGSLGVREIVDAIQQAAGITIQRSEIYLSGGLIRAIGEYDVQIHLHPDVVVEMKVNVVAA
jgi:large subunit ribosomal protein L9